MNNEKLSIKNWVRPNILNLMPYSSARDEFSGKEGIFLDANENPFGENNRYPDPHQTALKQALSKIKTIPIKNIFLGNGSDEVIDIAYRIFCTPNVDKVILCPPTYGMYEVAANINNINIISIPLNTNFQLDIDKILATKAKMIFICSPNNPTANHLDNIETIIQQFEGIVFVDEAYIDFSSHTSLIHKIEEYPNLIISQTFSKAWGLAGIRIGIAYSNTQIIDLYNKVKPPYNISTINQNTALEKLQDFDKFKTQVAHIVEQRTKLQEELSVLPLVKKIYPSDANFLLVEVTDADKIYSLLVDQKIITRNRHKIVNNCIRITVGTPKENELLLQVLKNIGSL